MEGLESYKLRIWHPRKKKWFTDEEIQKIPNIEDYWEGRDYFLKEDKISPFIELIVK